MIDYVRKLSPNTQGILSLVVALVFLTVSDSIIKWLSPKYALHQVMLIRALIAITVVLTIVRLEGGFHLLRTRRPWLHLLRGSLLVLANMFFFLGLASLPMAETVALFFAAPVFICLLSEPILGEKVGLGRWLAIIVGLAGVVVMVRPGAEVFKAASLLPIAAAFTYAAMQMVTRKLGMQDKAGTLTFYIQIAFILISTVSGLLIGDGKYNTGDNTTLDFLLRAWIWPDPADITLFIGVGVTVAFGGYFLSQAYRIAQASVVAPFEYASMPFALAAGFLVWGDWPDAVSFIGSGLIVTSGLLILYIEKQQSGRKARPHQKEY